MDPFLSNDPTDCALHAAVCFEKPDGKSCPGPVLICFEPGAVQPALMVSRQNIAANGTDFVTDDVHQDDADAAAYSAGVFVCLLQT